ncbi:MAG: alpha/beta hydrolase [Nocardioidaceae bacterium]
MTNMANTPAGAQTGSVTRSPELLANLGDGITLCYQTFGDAEDEPLLLVMGLGGPMIWWDDDLCERLARAGFYVIRYDNRDTGRSTRLKSPGMGRRDLVKAFLGMKVDVPYTMSDLAADGFGLLDHLRIDRAHLVGASMGGMIVQTMAIAHPERVLSLTSIMSTVGRRTVGWLDPKLSTAMLRRAPRTHAEYVESNVEFWKQIGSPGYPTPHEKVRERAQDTWDRGLNPAGVLRQMLAILTQDDRTDALGSLAVPTLVIHGDSDRMVHVSGGRATSRAVPGASLLVVKGMGHDLPAALFDTFVGAIRTNASRAT